MTFWRCCLSVLSQAVVLSVHLFRFVWFYLCYVTLFDLPLLFSFQFCMEFYFLMLLSVYIPDVGLPIFPSHFGVVFLLTLAQSK